MVGTRQAGTREQGMDTGTGVMAAVPGRAALSGWAPSSTALLVIAVTGFAASCNPAQSQNSSGDVPSAGLPVAEQPLRAGTVAKTIYWSDGDSGRIDGMPFRLADIDAPETGGVGARGGAKCESERELGFAAKAWVVELTRTSRAGQGQGQAVPWSL